MREMLSAAYLLSRDYFTGRGRLYVTATIALSLASTVLRLHVTSLARPYLTALTSKEPELFYSSLKAFAMVSCVAIPLQSLAHYAADRFSASWRASLTDRLIGRYMNVHYIATLSKQTDSGQSEKQDSEVETRIVDDVTTFTHIASQLLDVLVGKIFSLVGYAYMLWTISSTLFWCSFIYAILTSTLLSRIFGRAFADLDKIKARLVSRLRLALVNIRSSSEAIAFLRSEATETAHLTKQNLALGRCEDKGASSRARFMLVDLFQHRVVDFAPILVMAPRYFAGLIEYGSIAQAMIAQRECFGAFSILVDNLTRLSTLTACVARLHNFEQRMIKLHEAMTRKDELGNKIDRQRALDGEIGVHNLSLCIPGGHLNEFAFRNISFVFQGRGLLISGPSGAGKSSLLRAFAGLWTAGKGRIDLPEKCFFLPQNPFIPPRGATLASVLQYALDIGRVSDAELKEALSLVNLEALIPRLAENDVEWHRILSPGQTQRVSFARLYLWAAKAAFKDTLWAFLDESTSSLDAFNEHRMYELLRSIPHLRFCSVAHRPLERFHDAKLMLDKGCTLEPC